MDSPKRNPVWVFMRHAFLPIILVVFVVQTWYILNKDLEYGFVGTTSVILDSWDHGPEFIKEQLHSEIGRLESRTSTELGMLAFLILFFTGFGAAESFYSRRKLLRRLREVQAGFYGATDESLPSEERAAAIEQLNERVKQLSAAMEQDLYGRRWRWDLSRENSSNS